MVFQAACTGAWHSRHDSEVCPAAWATGRRPRSTAGCRSQPVPAKRSRSTADNNCRRRTVLRRASRQVGRHAGQTEVFRPLRGCMLVVGRGPGLRVPPGPARNFTYSTKPCLSHHSIVTRTLIRAVKSRSDLPTHDGGTGSSVRLAKTSPHCPTPLPAVSIRQSHRHHLVGPSPQGNPAPVIGEHELPSDDSPLLGCRLAIWL